MLDGEDNQIHQGEIAQLGVIIWNEDNWGDATDVNIEISSNYSGLIFDNSSSFIPEIQSSGVVINFNSPFIIEFLNFIEPGIIEFKLNITSNYYNNSFYETEVNFNLEVFEAPLILGDINNDLIINVTDILLLVNIILNGNPAEWVGTGADANQNNNVDVTDIITIIGIILGE